MQIRENYLDDNMISIKCPYIVDEKKWIVVHNTANSATADAEVRYMISNNNEISFHAAVDENEVVIGCPLDRNVWACGDGRGEGNMYGINIEICRSTSDDENLFDAAEDNAAQYIAQLLNERGWGIDRVRTHQSFSPYGKYCPHKTLDRGWDRFLNMIQNYMNTNNENKGEDMDRHEAEMYVGTCYVEYLHRLPDAGYEGYVNYLENGGDESQIDSWIKDSDEYNIPHCSNDNFKRNYIIQCYDLILGRFPESEGVIHEKMKHERLRDIYREIYDSEEARNRRGE